MGFLAAGFSNAPVMKGVVLTTAGSSLFYQTIAKSDGVPRYIHPLARAFVFGNVGELIFGVGLLYYFRLLERQTGSGKFGGFAFVTGALSCGLQFGFQTAYRFRRGIPTGPYGLIFASFVPFMLDVPPTSRFTVFGFEMSEKSIVYLAGIQLILSSGVGSMMAALCGVLAGLTYRANVFGLKRFKFPGFMNRFFSMTLGRLLDGRGSSGPRVHIYAPRNQSVQEGNSDQHAHAQPGAVPYQASPSPEAIAQLVSMGFDHDRAVSALEATGNNVSDAIAMMVG